MFCNERCWKATRCPGCDREIPPRGRSVPLGRPFCECERTTQDRHLWSEHDPSRSYSDPTGWQIHVECCEECKEEIS